MRDFKLNSTGNVAIENADFVVIQDDEEIAQSLKIRLKMWLDELGKGEWFLDSSLGVDYLRIVFKKHFDVVDIEAEIRRVITETFGVTRIEKYTQEIVREAKQNDVLKVKFTVLTIYSNFVQIDESLDI